MEHILNNDTFYDNGKKISKEQFEAKKADLLKVRELSVRLYNGEITESEIPENLKAKVLETVEIMRTPSVEENLATAEDYEQALKEVGVL